jgi:uncharacterized membrane protein
MRPVRSLDRSDLWFGIVLAALFVLVAVTLYGGIAAGLSWPGLLFVLGCVVIGSLLRLLLDRMGRAARFLSLFCVGVAGSAFIAWRKGQEFSLADAAGLGLALAIFDIVAEYFRLRREAANV